MDEDERTGTGPTSEGARLGAQVGTAVGSAVGTAVGEAVHRANEAATVLAGGYGVVRERVAATDAPALVKQVGEVLEGVVEDSRDRAMSVLGRQPPTRSRWRWAATAAVAGAAAGAAVAFAVKRLVGQDAPGAQEPDQLQAVVDTTILPGPADPAAR